MWINWRCLFDFSVEGKEGKKEPSWGYELGCVLCFHTQQKWVLTKAHYKKGNISFSKVNLEGKPSGISPLNQVHFLSLDGS